MVPSSYLDVLFKPINKYSEVSEMILSKVKSYSNGFYLKVLVTFV